MVAIAFLIACLETGGNILYHHSYAASYQPAQCLIQDEQVEEKQSSNEHDSRLYYMPEFTYQVITPDRAKLDIYPGYAGPGSGGPAQNSVDTSEEAQAILNRYQIGQIYPCWYSAFGIQAQAVLIFQTYACKTSFEYSVICCFGYILPLC